MAMGNVFLPYILEMSKAYSKKGELKDWRLLDYFNKLKNTTEILIRDNIFHEIRVVYEIE